VNCSEVQERLSAYHDSELSQDEAARVAVHVADCSSCAAEVASFEYLSVFSRQLTDPTVPEYIWAKLQPLLDKSTKPWTILPQFVPSHLSLPRLALAATVLIAVGIGAVAYNNWISQPEQNHLAVNFVRYLEEFDQNLDNAQRILLAKYDGQPITLTEATDILGYEPVVAKGLPPGYSIEKVHLLTMPCCTCAQVICTNKLGQSIAIFEHATNQPVWFGNRPAVEYLCHDMPTSVRQVGDRLAATWQEGSRHITIIGATDLDEVTRFVAHFKGLSSG